MSNCSGAGAPPSKKGVNPHLVIGVIGLAVLQGGQHQPQPSLHLGVLPLLATQTKLSAHENCRTAPKKTTAQIKENITTHAHNPRQQRDRVPLQTLNQMQPVPAPDLLQLLVPTPRPHGPLEHALVHVLEPGSGDEPLHLVDDGEGLADLAAGFDEDGAGLADDGGVVDGVVVGAEDHGHLGLFEVGAWFEGSGRDGG